jgi:hypothetical protein
MMLALLFIAFGGAKAFAFPEMTRHNYLHCSACHTSAVGGNQLNEYGRGLSRELLSQKSLFGTEAREGDDSFGNGLVKLPPWLSLQSDIRLLQLFSESKEASRGRFLIMQVDVDASAQFDRWRIFGSVGRIEPRASEAEAKDFVTSPRHGVEFRASGEDSEHRLTFRLGRFMPAYGIAFAEHTFVTRSLLDFNPAQERYGLETAWNNGWGSVIATGIASQLSGNDSIKEKGAAVQAAVGVREKSKLGVSYYKTRKETAGLKYDREIFGIFAHISFSDKWYGLFEADRPERSDKKWGLVEIFKLGYEIHQGLHLIGVQEFANLNTEQSAHKFQAVSLGAQWFPRPHWDLYGLYRRQRGAVARTSAEESQAAKDLEQDVVWLIGHYYF